MTITNRVQGAFFVNNESDSQYARLIRLAPNAPPSKGPTRRQGRPWTHEEHDRFLQAMEMYPSGPWRAIATHVATRTTRQTMTHAQKYRQKIARWKRSATIKSSSSSSSFAVASTPSSPVSTASLDEADKAEEDAVFWEILDDIVKVGDTQYFEEIMGGPLLHGSTQPPVTISPPGMCFSVVERGLLV